MAKHTEPNYLQRMEIRAAILKSHDRKCSYLQSLTCRMEELVIRDISAVDLSMMVEMGYRHFGDFFFRPACPECHACIPIRIPAKDYHFPRSARQLMNRNHDLTVQVGHPEPSREDFDLYRMHKRRFGANGEGEESGNYEQFCASFFQPSPHARTMRIKDDGKLIAVAHFDLTDRILSAVYCYYHLDYLHRSPGRYAAYRQIALAAEQSIPHVYLGFYIENNEHMRYKRNFRPNQVLLSEGCWVDFVGTDNAHVLSDDVLGLGFRSRFRLCSAGEEPGA